MKNFNTFRENLESKELDDLFYGIVEDTFTIAGDEDYQDWGEPEEEFILEAEDRKVKLNKPFRTSDGKGKFAVYAKNDKGNIVKVNFGDTTGLTIKTDNPDRRRSFRARHNCDSNPGPKWKARYWSCRAWSTDSVKTGLGI